MALSLSISTFAESRSCREKLQDKLILRNAIGGVSTVGSTIPVMSILIGASTAAGPAILPLAAGAGIVGGAYWLISTRKPKRLIKLIDQAGPCRGAIIANAYRAYEESHPSNQRMTKEEFCSDIVNSNRDGSLCPSGKLPSIKDVGRYYMD